MPMADAGEGLSYRDRLPAGWRPRAALPEGREASSIEDANLRVLAVVSVLEENYKVADEPTPQELELVRIHNKLNLLLELVSGLLLRDAPRPPLTQVRLSWQGVAWSPQAPLEAGSVGQLEIYLHPFVSQALTLAVRVVSSSAVETYGEFVGLSEPLQAALERHVFLHHRREVAETRQPLRATAKGHPPA